MTFLTRNGARRAGRVLAAGAALRPLLAGCAGQGNTPETLETPPPSGDDTDLRASWWGGESRAELFNQIIDSYESTLDGPTFETSFTPFDQYFAEARHRGGRRRIFPTYCSSPSGRSPTSRPRCSICSRT